VVALAGRCAPGKPMSATPSSSSSRAWLGHLLALNAAWFGLAYLWNGLHAILLPPLVAALVPADFKATALGALTFTGLLLAMLAQPVGGALSDVSGRRPWLLGGISVALALLAGLSAARTFAVVLLLYSGLQVTCSLAEAALQAMLPDQVAAERRGLAAGFKNAVQIIGFVAGVGLGGFFAGRGQIGEALVVAAVALGGSTLLTFLATREPAPALRPSLSRLAAALRRSFQFERRAAPGYARLLLGRGLLMAGYFAAQGFAQYFIADKLLLPNPARVTALLMTVMGSAIFLLAVPTGMLADRLGRRPLNVAAGLLGAAATLALITVHTVPQLVLVSGLIGASAGVFTSVNWAWAADLAPAAEAGRYLGLSNIATAGASAFSRLLAGPIIDRGNAIRPGAGYDVMFTLLACVMLAGVWVFLRTPETRPRSGAMR